MWIRSTKYARTLFNLCEHYSPTANGNAWNNSAQRHHLRPPPTIKFSPIVFVFFHQSIFARLADLEAQVQVYYYMLKFPKIITRENRVSDLLPQYTCILFMNYSKYVVIPDSMPNPLDCRCFSCTFRCLILGCLVHGSVVNYLYPLHYNPSPYLSHTRLATVSKQLSQSIHNFLKR